MQKGQDFIAGIEHGLSDNDTNLTVGNWIKNWLENYAKPHVRPRTYEKYSSSLKKYILPKDEFVRLIDEAKKINNSFMKIMMPEIISLTVHTGLRKGEVFGLKWSDIDFDKSCLFVRRSLANVIGKDAVFQSPKTKNSVRRVLLMFDDVESLKKYQQWQKNLAEELGDKFSGHGLVFTSPFGEPIIPTNFIKRYFKPLLKKCGISEDFTFHGLRHTHATLLLQQGVNPKIVQKRLGHS